jgi:hypothetical protein
MRRIRFSIASLLIVVLFLAVALASLREATDLWDTIVFSVAIGMFLVSVLLAVHRNERKRAYWLGFAISGWVYLGASLAPAMESRLLSTKALAYLVTKRPGVTPAGIAYFDNNGDGWVDLYVAGSQTNALYVNRGNGTFQDVTLSSAGTANGNRPSGNAKLWEFSTWKRLTGPGGSPENFIRIGHSLTALVLAFIGGHLSRLLYRPCGSRHASESGDLPSSVAGPDRI